MRDILFSLEEMPNAFELLVAKVDRCYLNWRPASWESIPSETFTVLGQACHLRDIEIEGYHKRFSRTLKEEKPNLESIDSYVLERDRHYHREDIAKVLMDFREARRETLRMLRNIKPLELKRPAIFAEYGEITLKSLIHILCSHDLHIWPGCTGCWQKYLNSKVIASVFFFFHHSVKRLAWGPARLLPCLDWDKVRFYGEWPWRQ